MNTSELKLKIFRQIDSLEKTRLEDLYGVLTNFINGSKEINDWVNLTDDQKQGIFDALEEIDSGKGIPHGKVISKYRKKYSHV
jgi:hypothetical protein